MLRSHPHARHAESIFASLLSGGLALSYAWLVSGTRYVTTGLQFVAPLAIILIVHLAWLAAVWGLARGFSVTVLARTLATAIGIVGFTAFSAVYAPMPAAAAQSDAGQQILVVLSCLFVLALVIGVIALIIYAFIWFAKACYAALKGPPDPPAKTDSRLFDAGAIMLSLLVIGTASLEGVATALTFQIEDRASSTVIVAASPSRVWQEVGKATSPAFPLPFMLITIPHPVAVLVDEGAAIGARRIVRFKGREGEGDLSFRVVRRTFQEAVFEVYADTTPVAKWVRHRAFTFQVEAAGTGSRLTVIDDYDRLLSPAWFFRPYVRVAAFLAMDVLARDTKARAELR